MAKAYWVAPYRPVSNPEALAAYAKRSGPAIIAAGGRILVRGMPALTYEAGLVQRTVVIECDDVEQAQAAMTAWPASRRWPLSPEGPSATFASSKRCEGTHPALAVRRQPRPTDNSLEHAS